MMSVLCDELALWHLCGWLAHSSHPRKIKIPMKRIAILGSTGSIGRSTLSVVESYPDASKSLLSPPAECRRCLRAGPALEAPADFYRPRSRRRNSAHQAESQGPRSRHRSRPRLGWNRPSRHSSRSRFRGQRHRGRGRTRSHLRSREGRARPSAWPTKNAWSPPEN